MTLRSGATGDPARLQWHRAAGCDVFCMIAAERHIQKGTVESGALLPGYRQFSGQSSIYLTMIMFYLFRTGEVYFLKDYAYKLTMHVTVLQKFRSGLRYF